MHTGGGARSELVRLLVARGTRVGKRLTDRIDSPSRGSAGGPKSALLYGRFGAAARHAGQPCPSVSEGSSPSAICSGIGTRRGFAEASGVNGPKPTSQAAARRPMRPAASTGRRRESVNWAICPIDSFSTCRRHAAFPSVGQFDQPSASKKRRLRTRFRAPWGHLIWVPHGFLGRPQRRDGVEIA